MTTISKKLALLALCATTLTGISQGAQAATVVDFILGAPQSLTALTAPNPLYGTALGQNNVVNSGSSGLTDTTSNPVASAWRAGTAATTTLTNYYITWYYAGSESASNISFRPDLVYSNTNVYRESDLNNNLSASACSNISNSGISGACGHPGPVLIGTYHVTSAGLIPFSFKSSGTNLIKNGNTALPSYCLTGSCVANASLIFSYLDPNGSGGLQVSNNSNSAWFAVALNDTGKDDNHDDMVLIAKLSLDPGDAPLPGPTPVPAALPLFGSVLGGGLLLGRWRKRRKAA